MLNTARVGLAQWLAIPGRPAENLATALGLIDQLSAQRCDLVVLPELWPCGYNWATLAIDARTAAEPLDGHRVKALGEAARKGRVWLAAGTVPERSGERIFNTALLFSPDGELCAYHRKAHLYEPMKEHLAVAAGTALTVCETDDFGTIGLSVCFDGDFPEVARTMARAGARVVIHPCAYEVEAESWWDRLYPAHALENGQWWIMVNQCGANPSGTLLGGSQIISPSGETVVQAPKVHELTEPGGAQVLIAEIELAAGLAQADKANDVLWRLRRPELYVPEAVRRFVARRATRLDSPSSQGPDVGSTTTQR